MLNENFFLDWYPILLAIFILSFFILIMVFCFIYVIKNQKKINLEKQNKVKKIKKNKK